MNMSAIEKLRVKHEKEIRELQDSCEHKQTTVMPHYWTIGHYSGYDVEVCDECGKIIRETRKTPQYTSEGTTTFSSHWKEE